MTEAPERIWASKSTKGQCVVSFSTPSEEYSIPYIRKDVADLARTVTVAEAAKVLLDVFEDPMHNAPYDFDWQSMYDEMSADHKESMEICGHHDWPSILIAALRAMSHK